MLLIDRMLVQNGGFRLVGDVALEAGARVAVMGPSGAGKSTLLAAVAGFLPLVSGRICWQGQDLAALPPGARPLTMLFQDSNLFPHLSAAQNVGLGLRPDLRLDKAEWARVAAVLDRVGLAAEAGRRPGALSGGQQGRVALARALIRARPLLLLDEPFAALGPGLTLDMLELVAEICSETGAGLVMVTHRPDEALALTLSAVVVAEGRVTGPFDTAALLADPPAALRSYLGRPPGAA